MQGVGNRLKQRGLSALVLSRLTSTYVDPKSWLSVALSGPTTRPPPMAVNDPPPQTHSLREAVSVRIRLHGTPAETAAILALLLEILEIREVSRQYVDSRAPMFQRIYLTVDLRDQEDTRQ